MNNNSTLKSVSSAAEFASRRGFLKVAGLIGGGLVIGSWSVVASAGELPQNPSFVANAFIRINADSSVSLTIPKIEMGQGTYTSLPMLIAEELEIDLAAVSILHAPPDANVYGGPLKDQFTGASNSIRTLWEPLRTAGAATRMILIQAAADQWQVSPDSCFAEKASVIHRPTGRKIRYGELIEPASKLALPTQVVLKKKADFKLIGKRMKRLDVSGKVNGKALYGIDTVLPNMLFASVAACPVFGGRLKSVDSAKALKLPGVKQIVRLDNAVAVIADNTWYARQGVSALKITWDEGEHANLMTEDIRKTMEAAALRPGKIARNDGDVEHILASSSNRMESVYINPMLAHAAMEPINCTVDIKPDSAEIWVGTQIPARARDSAALALGLSPDQIKLNGFLLGGAFGRRLHADFIDQAVLIGKQVRRPVKITWTREEDMQHDTFRGLYYHKVSAALDPDGFPVAWSHKLAGPSNIAPFAPGRLRDGLDTQAVEGSENLSYDIPNLRVEYSREDGPILTGFWRGVGPTRNVFALESFVDELAHKAGKDPLAYRLAMLKRDKRAHKVLTKAAEIVGWNQMLPSRSGRGIALLNAWGTYMAQVVNLSVDDDGNVKVQKVTCVVDCGMVVNPDTVEAQIQGGIIFGLTSMMYGEITVKNGRMEQSNFHDYQILRMSETPEIQVFIVDSDEAPGGIGEPGTAGLGPAFTNAIFAATGIRLYTTPIKPAQLAKNG